MGPEIGILNFKLQEKLDHHFHVEFHGESNGDGFEYHLHCFSFFPVVKLDEKPISDGF